MSGNGYGEPNLFLGIESESESCDDWDDTRLIEAYDNAVSSVKLSLLRKVQKELGMKDEDLKEFLSEAGSSVSKSKKNDKKSKKKSSSKEWVVGDSCRAVYSDDGEEYEAVIMKIIDSEDCIVKYIGYGNKELKSLKDLTPSLGKHVVQMQIEDANTELMEPDESGESKSEPPKNQVQQDEVGQDHFGQGQVGQQRMNNGYPQWYRPTMQLTMPPPPPPPPTYMCSSMDNTTNSMLMSWYLCGYYTGYYHSVRQENGKQVYQDTI